MKKRASAAWVRIATRGMPDERPLLQESKDGIVLADDVQDPRAGQHHGAHGGDQQHGQRDAHDVGAQRPEDVHGGDVPHLEPSFQFRHRRRPQEGVVEGQVENHDQQGAAREDAGQRAPRVLELAGQVGGRVPAGVRVRDVDERYREGAAEDEFGIARRREQRDGLRGFDHGQRGGAEGGDQDHLDGREAALEEGRGAVGGRVHPRRRRDQAGGQPGGREGGEDGSQVGAEGDRGQRGGGGEPDGGRNPPRHEARGGMVDASQKGVLAARTPERRAQFRVGDRAAEGRHAPDHPEQQEREGGLDGLQLESQAGEHPRTDHVGDHDRRRRVEAVPARVR